MIFYTSNRLDLVVPLSGYNMMYMKAIATNKIVLLTELDSATKAHIRRDLSYTDKSKAYQIKRMQRHPYHNKILLAKLMKENSVTSAIQSILRAGGFDVESLHKSGDLRKILDNFLYGDKKCTKS